MGSIWGKFGRFWLGVRRCGLDVAVEAGVGSLLLVYQGMGKEGKTTLKRWLRPVLYDTKTNKKTNFSKVVKSDPKHFNLSLPCIRMMPRGFWSCVSLWEKFFNFF